MYYPFVLETSHPLAKWLKQSCAGWTVHIFFFSCSPFQKISSPSAFLLVTTELLPCNLLCLHSFVFLQTLHPVTSGKGPGEAHAFILALGSSSDKLVYFSAWRWGLWVGKGGLLDWTYLRIWNTLCNLSSLMLFQISIWACLLLSGNAESFAQMDGTFWWEINLLSRYAGTFFLKKKPAKYTCSVVYGCVWLCWEKEQQTHPQPHFPAQKYPAVYQWKEIRRCAQPQTLLEAYGNIWERKYVSHFTPPKQRRNSPAHGGLGVTLESAKW